MGHGKGKSAGSGPGPTPPVADYSVHGTLTPDATCNYWEAGIYAFLPYYRRVDGAYFIWAMTPAGDWIINHQVADFLGPMFRRWGANIVGIYLPILGATGNAHVTPGPH